MLFTFPHPHFRVILVAPSGRTIMKPLVVILLLVIAFMPAASQTPAQKRLSFEVASIKPLDNSLPALPIQSPVRISGENVSTRGSVLSLLMAAYNLSALQISALPDWAK